MKIFTWIILVIFSSITSAHEVKFLSNNAHTIYHLMFWSLALIITIKGLSFLWRWFVINKC
jgi:hypothetical protein